jgi:hypothetical protein
MSGRNQTMVQRLARVLADPFLFSQIMLGMELRPYQKEPYRAVLRSVLQRQGNEFIWIFPRQSGKNEAVAHLLVYLLNRLRAQGGRILFAAVGEGLQRGLRRLDERLKNPLNAHEWQSIPGQQGRRIGQAEVLFMSAHPRAHVRGETAHWLVVIDEIQQVESNVVDRVFVPMRAANNATMLSLGTVGTTWDALASRRETLEQREKLDGLKRVFLLNAGDVAKDHPNYGRFVERQIQRYGRNHPVVASEFFSEPIDAHAMLFDRRRRQLMQGDHMREEAPIEDAIYVAVLDVAGQDEAQLAGHGLLRNPGRDATVCYIFRVAEQDQGFPLYHAVDCFVDVGSRHFAGLHRANSVSEALLTYLRHWNIAHLVADATGVGEGLSDWLRMKLGPNRVTAYSFSKRGAKAKLGVDFLTVIETARFRYWHGVPQVESAAWWFWQQVKGCSYAIRDGGTMQVDMRWGVPAGVKVEGAAGTVLLHDDHLIACALVAVYDRLYAAGKLKLGKAVSVIIKPEEERYEYW